MINKIIAISDINVRIYSEQPEDYKFGDIVSTPDGKYKFEVVEINNNSITSIPLGLEILNNDIPYYLGDILNN